MKKAKLIITSLILALVMLLAQVLTVFAAPNSAHSITGRVIYVEVIPDESTGITTVLITLEDEQTVRVSVETAEKLKLIYNDGEGYVIVNPLPGQIEIKAKDVITDEPQHPVGSALATFFSDIDGLTYDVIMEAHEQNGFGVIAQALWMTRKLSEENSELMLGDDTWTENDIFLAILDVKNGGNYSAFFPDDEEAPTNWGQFKKAVLAGDKKANLGAVRSHHSDTAGGNDQTNNGNGNNDNNGNNNNNGRGNGNNNSDGDSNGHGNGNGNGNNNGNGNGS